MKKWFGLIACSGAGLLCGCGRTVAPPADLTVEPVGIQMVRSEAELRNYPFRTLLDFEAPTDAVFIRIDGSRAQIDAEKNHTGKQSLRIEQARGIEVRLSALFDGIAFPGRWSLAGAYFHAQHPQLIHATYVVEGKALTSTMVEIPAEAWTAVLLDISAAADGHQDSPTGVIRFTFPNGLRQPVWCDDVVVIDNQRVHVNDGSWTVKEKGFQYTIENPGLFRLVLPTPEREKNGWILDEANTVRARFKSASAGTQRIIYWDGRQYPSAMDQPSATFNIPSGMGRVIRNGPGDASNDGFDESLGAFRLSASTPRFEFTIAPVREPLSNAVVQISGLGEGRVVADMEGRPLLRIARLADGDVLLALPGRITKPTLVSVRCTQ